MSNKYKARVWDFKSEKYVEGELLGKARELADRKDLTEEEQAFLDAARNGIVTRKPKKVKSKEPKKLKESK